MSDDRVSKWPARVFFVASGLFFFGCVWYLAAGNMNPEYYWDQPSRSAVEPGDPAMAANQRILLKKNHAVRVDEARIVYRGTREGALLMDLFVLELDPHYGYLHRIDEHHARQGFSIGDYHFQLLAASDDRISLKRL